VGVRRLHAFPGVALARDQRERPGVGRDEVRARHADLSVENLLAEVPTGESRQFLCGFERLVRLEHLVEQGRDLLAGLVNGRSDNVRGCLVGDLQDELGEVGLPDVRAAGFEGVVHFEPSLVIDFDFTTFRPSTTSEMYRFASAASSAI